MEPEIPRVLDSADLYMLRQAVRVVVTKVEATWDKATISEHNLAIECKGILARIVNSPGKEEK